MTTITVPGAAREPRLALGIAFGRTVPRRPSIADITTALDVLTALVADAEDVALDVPHAQASAIRVLAVVEHDGASLIISADGGGALRSWRMDGTPGPLNVPDAHDGAIWALAVVEHDGAPLIISADIGGALRSWRVDGTPGPLNVSHAHRRTICALAVVEHDGAPLIISADSGGALRSWRVDGTPGPLNVPDAHDGAIWALAVVEHGGAPLIISAGSGGALRSWRVDDTPGPLNVSHAHHRTIRALAVVEHGGAPLIISADIGGTLRSWRVAKTFASLQSPCASELKVHELSLGSLEIVVHLPIEILAPVAVGAAGVTVMKLTKILDAIKRMARFAPEVRLQRTHLDAQQLQAETRVLEAKDQLAAAQARHHERQLQLAGWELERAVLTDSEDQDVL